MKVSPLVFLVFLPLIADAEYEYFGEVPVVESIPDCPATSAYSPVCASDGINYLNSAVFDCADRLAGGTLKVLHHGACQEYEVNEPPAVSRSTFSYNRNYFSVFLLSFSTWVLW